MSEISHQEMMELAGRDAPTYEDLQAALASMTEKRDAALGRVRQAQECFHEHLKLFKALESDRDSLRAKLGEVERERDAWRNTADRFRSEGEKFAADHANCATEWAYQQVCAARTKWQERAEAAESLLTAIKAALGADGTPDADLPGAVADLLAKYQAAADRCSRQAAVICSVKAGLGFPDIGDDEVVEEIVGRRRVSADLAAWAAQRFRRAVRHLPVRDADELLAALDRASTHPKEGETP